MSNVLTSKRSAVRFILRVITDKGNDGIFLIILTKYL